MMIEPFFFIWIIEIVYNDVNKSFSTYFNPLNPFYEKKRNNNS